MQQLLNEHWSRAQRHESARDLVSARAEYEALLALDSRHVPAHLRLSRFEQFNDRYRSARRHALEAADAARSTGSSRHLGFVTTRLLDFSEDAEVASVLLSADWNDPEVLKQSPVLAQHLWLAGRYEDALRFLDAVIPRLPPHPLLAFTRANVLRYMGSIDEARIGYEASLAMHPDFADAHWALATHARAEPALMRVGRIRSAIARHAAGSLEQAHLYYALFRELDAADEPEAAWSALMQGAEIMAARVAYDPLSEARRLDALMALGPTSGDGPPASRHGLPVPVLVVGMPRTGTTLLDRILGNHPQVVSAGERNDFTAAVSEVSDHFFPGALGEADLLLFDGIDWRKVGLRYLQRLRQASPHGAYVIDKNPQNLFNLPLILRALPQARVLCLRRDPMDACFSNLKELFQGGAYPYSYRLPDLAAHCMQARRWMRYWAEIVPQSVKLVDYEALVASPGNITREVSAFLDLEPAGDLHDLSRNTAPVATASSTQVREAIHERSVGAWRRYAAQLEPLREQLERMAG